MTRFAIAIAAAALVASPASAAQVLFSFAGEGQTGSGTFTTATPQGSGGTAITGISGLFNGFAITGLSDFAGADNLFFFADPIKLSFDGVSFTSAGGDTGNLYYSSRGTYAVFKPVTNASGDSDTAIFDVTASFTPLGAGAVPEPGVWAFMVLGFGALGGALRRRRAARLALA